MHKIVMFTLVAALATGVTAPTANAESHSFQFLSPSGNVGCQMGAGAKPGSSFAWCTVKEHAWTAPQSPSCPLANIPGAIGEPGGEDLQLAEGKTPCFGFVMSQLFFEGQYAPPTLGYGDQRTAGSITCSVDPDGVTCADSKTYRSFTVSRDAYQLN